ncbi:MAG TPA: DUF885 family protein [Thermoanaerobaculia bacterium]|nr:DUF885 family protein [Thermoanaerobaculia bacterium]
MTGRLGRAAAAVLWLFAAGAGTLVADELGNLSRDFWSWRAANAPITEDDVPRIERPPGWTPEWTRASIERRRRELAAFEGRLERLDPSGMPVSWQVDRRLLRSGFARVRWELDVERGWERDPAFYFDQTLGAVFDLLVQPPPFSRARSAEIVRRLASIPATVESAKGNLVPAEAPFARLAISGLADVRARLTRFGRELRPLLAPESPSAFDAALERAGPALESYREWLGNRLPGLRPQTAVGREAYVFFLRNVALLPFSPEELLQAGRIEWARAVARETSEQARNASLPQLPIAADQAAQAARLDREDAAVRRFLEERNLLTVPSWVGRFRNLPLPGYLEALSGAGEEDDFGAESRRSSDAVRYIPVPSPALGYFSLSAARDPRPLLVHEGVPGHFFQLSLSRAHEDPIRRHYYDSSANEGLGFYAEEMMLDAGYFDDSPRTREVLASFLRLRALRVEVDVRLGLGELSMDQAAEYLARMVPMDAATAREEAAHFASTPGQAISYLVGKLQILRLLADARTKQGDRFSLRAFHDYLWKNGNVPLALLRWEYLGLRDDVDKLDASPRK